jgi:hypothetical protein
MHLVFDIFQGIGVAAAVGIRPFLPALAVGALAAGDVEIHFNGTDYSFLQSAGFLLALVVATALWALFERRARAQGEANPGRDAPSTGRDGPNTERKVPAAKPIEGVGTSIIPMALGALLFAGSLARGHYAAWPGWIGGVICAAIAVAATRPLLARVRGRLDQQAAGALPLYAEAAAVILAALSVVAPPVGPIGLALLVWLLVASRRREGEKYAGLRILK